VAFGPIAEGWRETVSSSNGGGAAQPLPAETAPKEKTEK